MRILSHILVIAFHDSGVLSSAGVSAALHDFLEIAGEYTQRKPLGIREPHDSTGSGGRIHVLTPPGYLNSARSSRIYSLSEPIEAGDIINMPSSPSARHRAPHNTPKGSPQQSRTTFSVNVPDHVSTGKPGPVAVLTPPAARRYGEGSPQQYSYGSMPTYSHGSGSSRHETMGSEAGVFVQSPLPYHTDPMTPPYDPLEAGDLLFMPSSSAYRHTSKKAGTYRLRHDRGDTHS